jgi:hypothetical protein
LAVAKEELDSLEETFLVAAPAQVARDPMLDQLGNPTTRKPHDWKTDALGLEDHVSEGLFLGNRCEEQPALSHNVEDTPHVTDEMNAFRPPSHADHFLHPFEVLDELRRPDRMGAGNHELKVLTLFEQRQSRVDRDVSSLERCDLANT